MARDILSCPLKKKDWVSFRLVDETGNGAPYAHLTYLVIDIQGKQHLGTLDGTGYGKIEGLKGSAVLLRFDEAYHFGKEGWYDYLTKDRNVYTLKITQLQYVAEQTRHLVENEPFDSTLYFTLCDASTFHYPFEVSDFVRYRSHLPLRQGAIDPTAVQHKDYVRTLVGKDKLADYGVGLALNQNHVLVVKALRAWRPVISTESAFSALNMFQLSLMATLAYRDFEDTDGSPINPWYSQGNANKKGYKKGGIGYVLTEWAHYRKPTVFGHANTEEPAKTHGYEAWVPFLEDVPYSKRFELVPFDPELYPKINQLDVVNDVYRNPATEHFLFEDKLHPVHYHDTQCYAVHSDQVVLLVPRGTQEFTDFFLDARAKQVKVDADEGQGVVHSGFYDSFKATKKFYNDYLTKFYIKGQHKIIVTGHSLGGAMATLTAEWIRNNKVNSDADVMLYTYGSPRVGDKTFVEQAKDLTHYRMVSHFDIIPTVPWASMSTKWPIIGTGSVIMTVGSPAVGGGIFFAGARNWGPEEYWHHGKLHHLTSLDEGRATSNRWLNKTVKGNRLGVMVMMYQPSNPEQSVQERAQGKDSLMVPLYSASNVIMWSPSAVGIKNDVLAHLYKKGKAYAERNGLPYEHSFWYDSFASALSMNHHFMLVSYVPAAWSVLTRWRDAVKNHQGQQISDQEYHTLYSGVANYSKALIRAEDDILYGQPQMDLNFSNQQIKIELKNADETIKRVSDLRTKPVTPAMIYGNDLLAHPELKAILARWEKDDMQRMMEISRRLPKS